jgi:cyclin B
MVCPDYLSRQSELNEWMRAILVDWLIEVHAQWKLIDETLFMAVHLMDRFLEKRRVKRAQFQLVGIASMLIATKFEENYHPEIHDFVSICDGAYGSDEIVLMESTVLNELHFQIIMPSTLQFVERYMHREQPECAALS